MSIIQLKQRPDLSGDNIAGNLFQQVDTLLGELRKRELPDTIITTINASVEEINQTTDTGKVLKKLLKQKETHMLKLLEKELKLVTKNYYRMLWMAVGMAAFGLPLGTALGLAVGNIGLMGAGLPFGLVIGMAVGTKMDKKAREEGRQLDMEIKY